MNNTILQTVVELPEYVRQSVRCMDNKSNKEFIDFIAKSPLAGEIISGTGGARKIRWFGINNKGKSGGVRIIYYYCNREIPIFLFTVYSKNKKANLTKLERNELKIILKEIVKSYLRRQNYE